MSETEYTLEDLEQLNAVLASIESDAFNANTHAMSAARLKRQLEEDDLTEEEREVVKTELENDIQELQHHASKLNIDLDRINDTESE